MPVYPALSFVRLKGGSIVLAETTAPASTGGDLKIRRYDGDNALASTTVLDSAVCDNSLGRRRDGTLDLFYWKSTGASGFDFFDDLKHRYSRDGGVTWSAEQDVTTDFPMISSNRGQWSAHCYLAERDALIWTAGSSSSDGGYLGALSSDGLSWTFTQKSGITGGTISSVNRQSGNGRVYVMASSILYSYTSIPRAAAVTSYFSLTGYSSYSWWCFDLDERLGRIVAIALNAGGGGRWEVLVGTMDSGGITWTWSTPQLVVSGVSNCRAWLNRNPDGRWEFAYVDSGGAIQWLRCSSISSAGVGTWS